MKELDKQIAVMQAFNMGKKVEARSLNSSDVWREEEAPSWNWLKKEYRAIREPKKIQFFLNNGQVIIEKELYHMLVKLHKGVALTLTVTEVGDPN